MANLPNIPPNMSQQQLPFSKDAIKSAREMNCINEIPLQDGPGFRTCDGAIFVDAHRQKYISKIMSPTGQETVAAVYIGKICVSCGKVFSPDEWLGKEREDLKATQGEVSDIVNKEGKADDNDG